MDVTGSRDEPLMTPKALAVHLGVSAQTLANWRWREVGPSWVRVGRYIRYRPADVRAWLDANAQTGAAA